MACRWIRSVFCFAMMASLCHAAVTIEYAYAWSGGLKNLEHYNGNAASFTSLSTSLSVPAGAGDDECLLIAGAPGGGTQGWNGWPLSTPAGDGTLVHIGFWLAIDNPNTRVIPYVDFLCFGPNDGDTANSDICLSLRSDGAGSSHQLNILNTNGDTVTTDIGVFEDDAWYWLDLYYQRLDSGAALIYVTPWYDSARILFSLVNSQDFNDGSGVGGHAITLDSQRGPEIPFVDQSTFAFKNLIIEYNLDLPSEGTFKVASFVSNPYKTGVVSDSGDNLSAGDWDDVSDSDTVTHGDLSAGDSGGIVTDDATGPGIIGPKDQFGSGVTVLGAKWSVQARNRGAAGLGGVRYGKYNGSTYTVSTMTHATCGGQCNVSYFEAAGGTYIPDVASEWFLVGGVNTNPFTGVLWLREVRAWMFTTYPYDEEAVSLIDRVPFRAQNRAERIGG